MLKHCEHLRTASCSVRFRGTKCLPAFLAMGSGCGRTLARVFSVTSCSTTSPPRRRLQFLPLLRACTLAAGFLGEHPSCGSRSKRWSPLLIGVTEPTFHKPRLSPIERSAKLFAPCKRCRKGCRLARRATCFLQLASAAETDMPEPK